MTPLPAQTQLFPVAADPLADCAGKKIGILIVAYNAVTTLAKVLQRIRPDAWDNVAEVVVFDDASQDSTYELALGYKVSGEINKLNIIKNRENLGYGGNQKAGYRYFMEKSFDVVVLLHGDGQYAPEILSHLYHPIVAGEADAVFGSRMMKDYGGPLKGGMPLYKYVGNRILTRFENRAFHMNLTEFHCGYRAYNLHALREIDFTHMTNDFHFDTEIIVKLRHQGFGIREVPIPTYYGDELCYVNGLKYARDVAKSVYRYRKTIYSGTRYPEYQEYWVHYPLKESSFSSHYYMWRNVGRDQRILDVGCGEGFLAAKVADQGNRVTGVDNIPLPKYAEKLDQYFQCDLAAGIEPVVERMGDKKFDRILLLDVLEHLPEPEKILKSCRELLAPRGTILVSLPNVANITVRLKLLLGIFSYTDRGILDRTHLRFFTRKTARRMLRECGYSIAAERMTVMPVELAMGLPASNPLMRLLTFALACFTRVLPGLLGYQSFFVARKKD